MRSIWLTYAWEDNETGDVDYAAQELARAGLDVKLDRWNLNAGKRLWEQIDAFITDPRKSNAWLLYATQASLGSEACKEEFAYALDRALQTRGSDFPVIALFPSTVDSQLIPAGIRTRLFVSLTDPEWKERIVAAAEGRQAAISRPNVDPFEITLHRASDPRIAIELRPRAGSWAPFFAAIPAGEQTAVDPTLGHGPAKRLPGAYMLMSTGEFTSQDGLWFIKFAGNEATPTQSYFVFCKELPSLLIFGVQAGVQYQVSPKQLFASSR